MSDAYSTGFDGTTYVGTKELASTEWSTDPVSDVQEFKNSKSGKIPVIATTYDNMSFTIQCDFEPGANPFGSSVISLKNGDPLTNTKLYINRGTLTEDDAPGDDALFWDIPSAKVIGTPMRLETAGKVSLTINARVTAPYGTPGNPLS